MYGLFQTVFYFGYMALFSGALGSICGTVGYIGATFFVRKIYSKVKIDLFDDIDCNLLYNIRLKSKIYVN